MIFSILLPTMAYWFSIIIIAANEEHIIGNTLQAVKHLSDDILVAVSNSTDNTKALVVANGAKLLSMDWHGYGATKNKANMQAKYDFILSLDADELPDNQLFENLKNRNIPNENCVYLFNRLLVWEKKVLQWAKTKELKPRLFNRNFASWDNALVHETLIYKSPPVKEIIKGNLLHYSYKNKADAYTRMEKYAQLSATARRQKNKSQNKTWAIIKAIGAFINIYFIHLGFLDGSAGFALAKLNTFYTFNKYSL